MSRNLYKNYKELINLVNDTLNLLKINHNIALKDIATKLQVSEIIIERNIKELKYNVK